MNVATLRLELRIGDCHTLREKRRRMRAIMTKLHRHFNVSVAEADRDDEPALALLVVAAAGRHRRDVRATLDRVAEAVAAHPRAELLSKTLTEF
jgi:MYXO-CTERM domain-containing protein